MTHLLRMAPGEIRSPLAAVIGYASTFIDYYDQLNAGEQMENVRGILHATHQLEVLVADILSFSRIEDDVFHLNLSNVSLGAFLREAIESFRASAPGNDIRLSVNRSDPDVRIDTGRFLEVIDNLLENAVRHGDPPVEVSVVREDNQAVVSVTDRGPGVPEESLDEVFEPFARVRHPSRRDTRGTGLGLSVCRRIVEKHGGRIWAERPASDGFQVKFTLPLNSSR